MKKYATLLAAGITALFVGACCRGPHGPGPGGMMPGMQGAPCPGCPARGPGGPMPGGMMHGGQGGPAAPAPRASSAIYWCGSAADGMCSGVSTEPGTCPDGSPMNSGHVVYTEGTTALVCTCGPSCACAIDPKDRTKCGCGKPVRRIDLAGTGIYFCNCGGSCGCNTVSSAPGKCRCGMDLRRAQ